MFLWHFAIGLRIPGRKCNKETMAEEKNLSDGLAEKIHHAQKSDVLAGQSGY
jgi:hypothetical protein